MKESFCRLAIWWIVIVAVMVGFGMCLTDVACANWLDCYRATCRVSADGGARGTGCCFRIEQGYVFVLTNAHVVGSSSTASCEFYLRGHQSRPIRGKVVVRKRHDTIDAAIIALPVSAFGDTLPVAVPLANKDLKLSPGQAVFSIGCAGGSWPTAWEGHATGYSGGNLQFVPSPAGGRSGSAIFDAEGTQIVGLLHSRRDGIGGVASTIQALRAELCAAIQEDRLAPVSKKWVRGRCGTYYQVSQKCQGQCPPDCENCPPRLFDAPWRKPREKPTPPVPPSNNPYPSLPPQSGQSNPAPEVDLDPLADRLDRIADLIAGLKTDAPDGALAETLQRFGLIDEQLKATAETVDNLSTRVESGEQVMKKLEMITGDVAVKVVKHEDRIGFHEDRLGSVEGMTGTTRDKLRQRIEDAKAELGDDASKKAIIKAVVMDIAKSHGGIVGIVLVVGLFFLRKNILAKIEAGEPLLIQRVARRFKKVRRRIKGGGEEETVEEEEEVE